MDACESPYRTMSLLPFGSPPKQLGTRTSAKSTEQGLLSLTNTNYPRYYSGSLHEGTATVGNSSTAIFSENFKLTLKNTRRIYEHKVRCHTKASYFNCKSRLFMIFSVGPSICWPLTSIKAIKLSTL